MKLITLITLIFLHNVIQFAHLIWLLIITLWNIFFKKYIAVKEYFSFQFPLLYLGKFYLYLNSNDVIDQKYS